MRRIRRRCRSVARQRSEVGGAGVVALVLQPVRSREPRAVEAQLRGPLVHQPHEAGHRAGAVLRERDRGVVARHEQQPVQKRLELDLLAARQHADRRAGRARRAARDPHALVRILALDDQQRGHHLREARDRQPAVRVAAPQHAPRAHVEQQAGARLAHEAQLHRVRAGQVDAEARCPLARRRRRAACGPRRAAAAGPVAVPAARAPPARTVVVAPALHRIERGKAGPQQHARGAAPAAAAASGERRRRLPPAAAAAVRRASVSRHPVA